MAKHKRVRFSRNSLRYPKTTQELRANQFKNDPYIRSKRRNLPTVYADQFVHLEKSWKSIRKNQYRNPEDSHYQWREFEYNWSDKDSRLYAKQIIEQLFQIGCYYEFVRYNKFKWYGPDLTK